MPKRTLTDTQRSLLQVSLELARDHYKDNAAEWRGSAARYSEIDNRGARNVAIGHGRLAEQFERQERETQELINLIGGAGAITIIEYENAG